MFAVTTYNLYYLKKKNAKTQCDTKGNLNCQTYIMKKVLIKLEFN